MLFSFAHRILANWLQVKFMGRDGSVGDTNSEAGGIQTLALFHALSSKGDRTVAVNVCIKVGENPKYLLLWFFYFTHSQTLLETLLRWF